MPKMPPQTSQTERCGTLRKPIQKATVIKSARKYQSQAVSSVDKTILERIQKYLDCAYHANTIEAEAKIALFVAQKLMSQHNVSQADLMVSDDNGSKARYGGRSIVCIKKIAGSSKRVLKEAFTEKIYGKSTIVDQRLALT